MYIKIYIYIYNNYIYIHIYIYSCINFVPITCLISQFWSSQIGPPDCGIRWLNRSPRVELRMSCASFCCPKNRFYRRNICLGDYKKMILFKIHWLKKVRSNRCIFIEYLVWPPGGYLNRYVFYTLVWGSVVRFFKTLTISDWRCWQQLALSITRHS